MERWSLSHQRWNLSNFLKYSKRFEGNKDFNVNSKKTLTGKQGIYRQAGLTDKQGKTI